MTSKHYTNDRAKREEIINKIGQGQEVYTFIIDRGHRNGAEIHAITTTGIINIYNQRTKKLVTKLIARPGQIKRYFAEGKAPKNILKKTIDNTVNNCYNLY